MKKTVKYFVAVALVLSFSRLFSCYAYIVDVWEETPLMKAAGKGNLVAIKKLIVGANVNAVIGRDQPHIGKPVLQYAIDSGSTKAVEILIKAGADVNWFSDKHSIYQECHERGPSARNLPLISSAISSYASIDIIKALVDANADVNKTCLSSDLTPLMIAAYRGYDQAVKVLLDAGADKTLKNHKDGGRLAIDYAKEQGHADIVSMLEN